MNKSFSIYLDIIRFSAAFLVYLDHSNQRFLIDTFLPASGYGHSAVVFFFVLSGFVISYVTDTKENTWQSYSASRISRIISVTIPAIFFTIILDSFGRALRPEIYQDFPYDQLILRTVGSFLMLNEVWLISITFLSNIPYWSVTYEWWYYVAFAMITFLPTRKGLTLAALLMVAIGPKVILLAPIWWLGVFLYRSPSLKKIPTNLALVFFILSTVAIFCYHNFKINRYFIELLKNSIGSELNDAITFSGTFLGDYVLAVFVLMNFAGARKLLESKIGEVLIIIERPVRFVSSFTFTLYLLHFPLILFWSAVLKGNTSAPWYWLTITAFTMTSIILISSLTENRRHSLNSKLLYIFKKISKN